jgi:hypothetical protein
MLLMLLGRDVNVIREWGQLVLGYEGVRRIVKGCEGLQCIVSRFTISLCIISSI